MRNFHGNGAYQRQYEPDRPGHRCESALGTLFDRLGVGSRAASARQDEVEKIDRIIGGVHVQIKTRPFAEAELKYLEARGIVPVYVDRTMLWASFPNSANYAEGAGEVVVADVLDQVRAWQERRGGGKR